MSRLRPVFVPVLLLAVALSSATTRASALGWDTIPASDMFVPLDVCHDLLTKGGTIEASCQTRTDWDIVKSVFPEGLAAPNRNAVTYNVTVVEGETHLELEVHSVLKLTGHDEAGTAVRGIVVNLQMEMGTQHQFVTVASGTVGEVNPYCGCGYVGAGENLDVTVRNAQQQEIAQPTQGGVIDFLPGGEQMFVRLDTRYDVTAGTVPQGTKVRLQACVQYASVAADDVDRDLCTIQGGALRVTKGCTAFPFDAVAKPDLKAITLREKLGAPTETWVATSGFKATVDPPELSGAAVITPDGAPRGVVLGSSVLDYTVMPSGLGSVRTLSVKGSVSCGDKVACATAVDGMCVAAIANEASLIGPDGLPIASASASLAVGCTAYQCNGVNDPACDDGNPCTDDRCDLGLGCIHDEKQDGLVCDDGDACSTGEQCLGGVCLAGTTVQCADDGNPCTLDECDRILGECVYVMKPNRTGCDDANSCTRDDKCIDGQCLGGALIACADDGNSCTADTCDPVLGCVRADLPNRTPCDDKNPCTVDDKCIAGPLGSTCEGGAPTSCDDGNPCTTDTCVPGAGCQHQPVANRTACNDNNACTVDDSCIDGACVPGSTRSCDDQNSCTADACDPLLPGGCAYLPLNGPCDDKDACTTTSVCAAGQCVPGPQSLIDCDDANPCTRDRCDAQAGCVHDNITDGSTCDDGDPCSDGDRCLTGTCTSLQTTACDDANACTASTCLPGQGCVHIPRTGLCDDGNPCTGPDTCVDRSCVSGAALTCDDENPCTQDSCSLTDGCRHAPLDGVTCDDSDACTPPGTCHSGLCQMPPRLDCDDDNPCTMDQCDPTQGCVYYPLDGPCDDGDICTGIGHCELGQCQLGDPITCDDGDVCTRDVCRPAIGCAFLARSSTPCNDNNPCTTADVCQTGVCVGGGLVSCDDNNPCTTDSCDAAGCHHAPRSGACEDGNLCTLSDACQSGVCIAGKPRACADTDSCTSDTCDAATGQCVFSYRGDGTSCDDTDVCTGCPWPEAVVKTGYRASDAVPDPTYFAATVRPVTLELTGIDGPGMVTTFSARSDVRLVILSDADAALRGTFFVTSGGGRDTVIEWSVDLVLRYRGLGKAGQGGSIFAELPAGVQTTPYSDTWKYWDIKSTSTMTRISGTTSEKVTLGPDALQQSLPLQVGLRANGRNLGFGAAGPVRWMRLSKYGQGVLRLNLAQVFCQRSDVCQGNQCTSGTLRATCRDIDAGDYCTYDDRDFSGGCGRTGGTSAACVLAAAWPKLAVERTSCAAQLGFAFGFNGYRRLSFTALANLVSFMPSTGPGSPAQIEVCNPGPSAGTASVSHALALDLSIALSDLGATPAPLGVPLGDLVWNSGTCTGISLREITRRAEMVASGVRPPDGPCYDGPTLAATVGDIIQGFYRCQATTTKALLPE